MNVNSFSNGFRRLFGFSAIAVVATSMLVLTGCGHKCECRRQNSGCSTCNTCNVSENTVPPPCAACAACQASTTSSYDRVGSAPPSLSEPLSIQTQTQPAPTYSVQPSTYAVPQSTNTSVDRPGDSRDLPVFSKSVAAPVYRANEIPEPTAAPIQASQPAATILNSPGQAQTHTLQKGETIYALSRQYGVKPKAIIEANHFNDPNHLSVGTKVIIPAN